jgi:hypothetical protein
VTCLAADRSVSLEAGLNGGWPDVTVHHRRGIGRHRLARGGRYRPHWSRVGCYHPHYRLLLGLAGGNDVRL